MKEWILIDAYAQIFRCFYAIRELTDSAGRPTNALLPFCRLLLKLQQDFPDNPGAFFFDCGRVQFRLALIPEYKANRPPMPEALRQQLPVLRELADAFGWPMHEEPEYEADDLIAAFTRHTTAPVRIVSSDKDLAQLIDDRVAMLIPDRRNTGWELRDRDATAARFAVRPDQIVDYLALIGDASDNIPGVPGIGPKTAAALLEQFGTIDAMLAAPEQIAPPRRRELLDRSAALLDRNRKLIRLRDELPARFAGALDGCCRRRTPDWRRIDAICAEMELRSIRRELPAPPPEDDGELPLFAAAPPAAPAVPTAVQGDLFENL